MKQLLNTHERLIRLPDVKLKTGLGRTSIYMKMKDRSFPLCINLGGRSVARTTPLDQERDRNPEHGPGQNIAHIVSVVADACCSDGRHKCECQWPESRMDQHEQRGHAGDGRHMARRKTGAHAVMRRVPARPWSSDQDLEHNGDDS